MVILVYSKLINKVVREVLKFIGLVRKGQFWLWLDDNVWWLIMVEFQLLSWFKGIYFNVGISQFWYFKDYMLFDIGY